ncbi:tRNA (uridine(34)/cytosine(34)/5-carboxymethylaminomethyluridine(34)-2'-O)-methyltransferase TrmL [Halobacteriovorax marinus]|uniref:Putative tRNA (cytidine(34)-2'-O)-methyltransferase n=1 Tax=Halobacteriovorax marinus TaxID=97084 RepID=A0A1Y5F5J4_9BACT|nr:tRNA (uridine(34)/cytosine(34)/5-carboxymethylaminomethyluridine(34)-2'-O)-methyltransferase TrmL [Halobacteriovorax marinus]
MNKSNFKIVLYSPEIPGNTGSIGRTCVALNAELILIHPLGFDIDEKAVRRAGLDYWKHVKITEYQNFQEFLDSEKPQLETLHFFTKNAKKNLFETSFKEDCYLVFGCETKGLPQEVLSKYQDELVSLPILSENIRSLNLASVATTAAYEAIRQIKY